MSSKDIDINSIIKSYDILTSNRCAFVFSLFMDKGKFKKWTKSYSTDRKKCNVICQNICEYLGYAIHGNVFNKDVGNDIVNCMINMPEIKDIQDTRAYKVAKVNNVIYITNNKNISGMCDLCYIKSFMYYKYSSDVRSNYGITNDIDLLLSVISIISNVSIDNVYTYIKQFIRTFTPSKDQLLLAVSIYFIMTVNKDIEWKYTEFAITDNGIKNIYKDGDSYERQESTDNTNDTTSSGSAGDEDDSDLIVVTEDIDDSINDTGIIPSALF